ncbi:hypothetical protein [Lachnoclostridium sp. An181]|uniref:hypothetical protein n=1 Tax=Lachnoclostridium sp. An181 TaxID=1965575 RepID=UPI000B3809A3|nr:hypothetical protein [Lachnoclostridium sp. An181]OUP51151.1 hypothetical protein B5F18_00060 [Lachnoclostridium sp. An181]
MKEKMTRRVAGRIKRKLHRYKNEWRTPRLLAKGSESSRAVQESSLLFAKKLACYDVISFDVFDTLIFRPFFEPSDLFYLLEFHFSYPGLKKIRVQCEESARKKKWREKETYEVTLEEIWAEVEKETHIPQEVGVKVEWEYESCCCLANPYLFEVVKELQKQGKTIVAVSDMYLGEERIHRLLSECGYKDFSAYFVSCDYEKAKVNGELYQIVKEQLGSSLSYVHIGDHVHSDEEQALKAGIDAAFYPNINRMGKKYRVFDLSVLTGSIYRGIVNTHLYNGSLAYSKEYEYGFVYGGLFVVGYCQFIHACREKHKIEKLLFLSRDGKVLKKVYETLYPDETDSIAYVFWSRLAALKLSADYYRHEYFERFLFHKIDQGFSIQDILMSMELEDMQEEILNALFLQKTEELTYKNAEKIKDYLLNSWDKTMAHYTPQAAAAKAYFSPILKDVTQAAAIDVGWAGSGALMLDHMVNDVWKMDCKITGILAGTNTLDRESGESFLFFGKLVSYLYSQQENRDLWKFHRPVKGHNLYWELLLGEPAGSFIGFYPNKEEGFSCKWKETPKHAEKIREIHRGILDFANLFEAAQAKIGMPVVVSGRDAYAPMLAVLNKKNRAYRKSFHMLLDDIHVG